MEDSRPFEPTPRRRQQARADGRFVQSRDWLTLLLTAMGLTSLYIWGPAWWSQSTQQIAASLQNLDVASYDDWFTRCVRVSQPMLLAALPMLLLPVAICVLGKCLQTNFWWSFKPLTPQFSRILPTMERLNPFSAARFGQLLFALFQGIIVGTFVVLVFIQFPQNLESFLVETPVAMDHMNPTTVTTVQNDTLLRHSIPWGLLVASLLTCGMVGLLDYLWAWYRHESQLRMTAQELKEEQRELQGDPQTTARRQRLRSELTAREMESIARPGDILVHALDGTAVLLRYSPHSSQSPQVLASAMGVHGKILMKKAVTHGAHCFTEPELTQRLIHTTRPGVMIPPAFYQRIAELFSQIAIGEKSEKT